MPQFYLFIHFTRHQNVPSLMLIETMIKPGKKCASNQNSITIGTITYATPPLEIEFYDSKQKSCDAFAGESFVAIHLIDFSFGERKNENKQIKEIIGDERRLDCACLFE